MAFLTKRNSRKPTFAGDEKWFLVQYEDQPDTLRVLNEEEIKKLDSEDEDEMNEGDTILAYWAAEKKFYEAELIEISDEKNDLLKKRSLEVNMKNSSIGRATNSAIKRSQTKSEAQTKKPKHAKQADEKAHNKKDKKSKEAEKAKANKMREAEIAARIAQAKKRISGESEEYKNPDQNKSTPTKKAKEISSDTMLMDMRPLPITTPTAGELVAQTSKQAQTIKKAQKVSNKKTVPNKVSKPITARVQKQITPLVVSDGEEEDISEGAAVTMICNNADCQILLQENNNLKEKLKKLQRRLDIAVKAKSPASMIEGKPAAGVLDPKLALEYQMKEFLPGSGVFWYTSQRSICTACATWEEYVNTVVDIFFDKETLKMSCARGLKKGKKLDNTVPLCKAIADAIIGKVCARFQPPPTVAQIVIKINQKCTEARRKKRVVAAEY